MAMSLFTSLSKRPAWVLLGALLLALPMAWVYTLWGNPEHRLNRAIFKRKQAWVAEIRRESPHITVISGGSSSSFQVDSDLLHREFGAHVANTGLSAGLGLDGTVALSTTYLKPGDRLLLMTEPPLLEEGGGLMTALTGQVMILAEHRETAFFSSQLGSPSFFDFLLKCRPGIGHCVTMVGKLARGGPLFRYQIEDFGRDGFACTSVRNPVVNSGTSVIPYQLNSKGRNFLKELKNWADQRQIEVVYLLPVFYTAPSVLEGQREANRHFLKEISEILPVWADEYLGCSSNPEDFADTPLHMTKTSAQERTRVLGRKYGELLRSGNSALK